MTDKEKIKEEIEKQIDYAEDDTRYTESYREGLIAAYQTIKAFIDSLPEEHASEDLDRLVISLEETIGTSPHSREVIKEHFQKAAEWGRNHFEDKSEMVSKDLEEEMIRWHNEHFGNKRDWGETSGEYLTRKSQLDVARHFAEWQKQKYMQDFVEKACKFLKNRTMAELCLNSELTELVDDFVEQFKNYMKNESEK